MSISTPVIASFTSGEISPRLAGRVDVAKYYSGCKTLENFHVHPHGGITRRSGFRFVVEAVSNSEKSRLIPFEFSETQTYVLEFSPLKMRVFTGQGVVKTSEGEIYERATPFTAEDIAQLNFCQSLDTLILTCPGHQPQKLTRTAHDNWTLSGFSAPQGAGLHPTCCCFYQDRLFLATADGMIHFSKISDYWNFTMPAADAEVLADAPGQRKISSGKGNRIEFLLPKDVIYVGTQGGTWTVFGKNGTFSTPDVGTKQASTVGAASVVPVLAANSALYIQRAGRRLMEMAYNFQVDSYPSNDMTIFAEHITRNGIKELAYLEAPDSIIYGLRNDGTLLACTYYREQNVVAWSRIITKGKVESIASIHNDAVGRDELWAVVLRNINGTEKRFVEFIEAEFDSVNDDTAVEAFFLDAGVTFDLEEKTKSLSGLEHLAGAEVEILVDGAVIPNETVAEDGKLELTSAGQKIHVGLGYSSVVEPMPLEFGSHRGTSQTKPKLLFKIAARFYNTLGGKMGMNPGELDVIYSRAPNMPMGQAVPLFTGDKELVSPTGWTRGSVIHIRQDQPLPMTVLMVVPTQVINT
ncbi:hypothetical protein [Maridesulfovibrio sp.]|uniref:hypothetical protein n=1 Tax=Maridesulfovibrio sp. TaxID=2795000 RepID=UPI002A18B734|nr:hypothetical protein [Maridesulfovibrio sp.]